MRGRWGRFSRSGGNLALPGCRASRRALIRPCGATVVLVVVARLRGVRLFARDGTLGAGLVAGILFGFEFVLIYHGLLLTTASRAVVFLYTAPFFVAVGSYQFLGERLRASQWGGLALSFPGVGLAIGLPQADVYANVLWGDLVVVGGRPLWAARLRATPRQAWPSRFSAATTQTFAGPSSLALASDLPSGLKTTPFALSVCPMPAIS